MKLRCPACGSEINFEEAARGGEFEALGRAQAAFGADFELISEYLEGFKARRDGRLALKKRLRLLREMWEMWHTCRFQLGGEEYQIGREEFREALAQVANRELSGLKNHNYLKQVLKVAARKTSVRQEKERLDREQGLGNREAAEVEVDPRIPKLVKLVLFARTEAERDAAQAELDRLRRENQ